MEDFKPLATQPPIYYWATEYWRHLLVSTCSQRLPLCLFPHLQRFVDLARVPWLFLCWHLWCKLHVESLKFE
eukprot:SAG22_NODE_468_length_10147_cov_77.238654_7_plen_72_part_00